MSKMVVTMGLFYFSPILGLLKTFLLVMEIPKKLPIIAPIISEVKLKTDPLCPVAKAAT